MIYKEGATVRGLTTAASIWLTAAIGISVWYWLLFSCDLSHGVLPGDSRRVSVVRSPHAGAQYTPIIIFGSTGTKTMPEKDLRALLSQHGFSIANMAYRIMENGETFEYRMVIRTTDPMNTSRLADELRRLEIVREFRISPTGD